MPLGDVIARLSVVLGMDTAAFEQGSTLAQKQLNRTRREFEKLGDKIGNVGAGLSVALSAPLAALGKASVDGFIAQEKAIADVEAALQSMGGASGKTSAQLSKMADQLELNSLFDAEVILKDVSAQLLTFGNISGDVFDRAQQAVLDYSQRTGKDLVGASIMVGKALQDPIKGVAALSKAGVQLTDDQKALVKQLVATGDVAGAQSIILGELEKQNRGAAAAAADATPWRQAQKAIGQAMDTIGAAILPAIVPVAEAIAGLARAFSGLPGPAQKAIVVVAALAAALGPVLLVLGPVVSAMAPFLASLKLIGAAGGGLAAARAGLIGLTTAALPLAAAAGAAYLVWRNWDDIAPRLQPLVDQLTAIGVGLGLVEADSVRTARAVAENSGWHTFGEILASTSNGLQKLVDDIDAFNAANTAWATTNGVTIPQLLGRFAQGFTDVSTAIIGAGVQLNQTLAAAATSAIASMQRLYTGVKTWLQDKLGQVFEFVNQKVRAVEQTFAWLYDRVVGNSWIPDMVDEVGQNMAKLDALMVAPARSATAATDAAFRELAGNVSGLLDRLFPEFARLKALRDDLATIDAGETAGLISGSVAENARFRRRQEEAGPRDTGLATIDPGKAIPAEAMRQQMDKFAEAMGVLERKSEVHTVRIAQTFRDMATETLSALDRMTSAVKGGGFLDILGAVLNLGLQLGGIGVFGKKIQSNINRGIPGFANGTGSAPRGLALVGERGPELVAFRGGERVYTNAQSRGMMGGGGTRVQVVPSPYFDVVVDGRVQRAAPAIAGAGADLAASSMARSRKWSLS